MKSLTILLVLSLCVISITSVVPSAYAGTLQPEYDTSLPSALVNYNSDTNKVTITWDFSGLEDYTDGSLIGQEAKCAVKGDYDFNDDPVTDPDLEITSFQPIEYSPTYLPDVSAGILTSITDSNVKGEEIPCTGQLTIDLDTVMADDKNTGPYVGVEPFISFYIMTSNEEFDTADDKVIDEVLIMYHPNAVEIDQDTIDWACGANDHTDEDPKDGIDDNQIALGNVLFIDQSGIRGTGGPNNCDTIIVLESLEFCCIFTSETESKYTGSSCSDCVAPTFGKDANNFLIVTNGFSYNGNVTDVTEYHTEFPLITVITNQTNIVLVKVYENNGINNIKLVQFGLGMPDARSSLEHAETLVEIWLEEAKIIDIIEWDDKNLVTVVAVETSEVDCGGASEKCLAVKLQYFYRDQPKYNIMAINAIDFKRNSQTNYLNDGVEVIGESLNEPLTQKVTVSQAGAFYPQKSGSTILTLSDYKTDTWIDEYGYIWSTNEYGPYLVDTIHSPEQTPDVISPWSGYNDRLHSEFGKYVKMQQEKAAIVLDEIDKQERNGIMNIPTVPDNEVVFDGIDREDLNLSQSLVKEAQKILVKYEKQNNPSIYKESEKHIFTQTIKEIKPKAFLDVKILNNALTITGNIGDADTNKPVILKSIDGEMVLKKPILVNPDGLFNMGFLSNDHTNFVLSHDGVILKEFDYSTLQ